MFNSTALKNKAKLSNYGCPIYKGSTSNPQGPAVIYKNSTYTYKDLNQSIKRFQSVWRSKVSSKDRVAFLCQPSPDYIIALWALWRQKAISVHLNSYNPKNISLKQIRSLNCQLVVTDKFLNDFKKYKGPLVVTQNSFDIDQELDVIFTSGSSREPKACLHTFGNHYYSALGSHEHIPFRKNDRWLLCLPLYHVSGLSILFRSFIAKGAVILSDNIITDIRKHNVTHASLVSTQLIKLIKEKKNIAVLRKLKAILLGGSAISPALLAACKKYNLPVYISYGLTEMSSQVATSRKLRFDQVKTLRYRQLRIAKDGEILVKGHTLFKGYLHKGKLDRARDKDGWFHTKDLGEIQKRSLRVFGRKDNMFISGGENIQPEEIERTLLKIKGIEEAIVVPQKDKQFGQRPIAFIKGRFSQMALRKNLSAVLPKYKIPVEFYPWPKKVKSSLKISRLELKKLIGR